MRLMLEMHIPGQIPLFNTLKEDGSSTGNTLPSGNNEIKKQVNI